MGTNEELAKRGFSFDKKGNAFFNANHFVKYITDGQKIIYTNNLAFYVYEDGVYEEIELLKMLQILREILQEPAFGIWCYKYEQEYLPTLQREVFYDGELNYRKDLLNLENNMLDIENLKLLPFDPEYYSSIRLPVKFDKESRCPRFLTFLSEIFLGDQELINLMQEVMGYVLTTSVSAQVFFIFLGTGGNGKSILLDVIESMLGLSNVSNVPLNELSKSFSRITIKDKLLNISTETETNKPINSQYLKAITTGETITAEKKGCDIICLC